MDTDQGIDIIDITSTRRRSTDIWKSGVQFVRQFLLFFFGDPAKLVRFAITGGLAAVVQLGVLRVLTADHWEALLSNGIGMAVAAQVNFTLSSMFTWRDRWVREGWRKRWSMYQLTILVSAIVNMLVFILARLVIEQMFAAIIGILAAATLNFAAGDRLIFRLKQAVASLEHEHATGESPDEGIVARAVTAEPRASRPVEIAIPVYREEPAFERSVEVRQPSRERGDHGGGPS
jgi:putative flippase GtrA